MRPRYFTDQSMP